MTDDAQPDSDDTTAAANARAFLEANGVRGITIAGSGESWRVGVGWNEHERFVIAYSEKNPATPNDPGYLAEQALATLIRNEGPCPHVTAATQANETFSRETDEQHSAPPAEGSSLELGAEILDFEAETGEGAGDEGRAAPVDLAPDGYSGGQEDDRDLAGGGSDLQRELPDTDGPGPESALKPIDADYAELPALEEPPPSEPESAPAAESVAIFGPPADRLPVLKLIAKGKLSGSARQHKAHILGDWSMAQFREQQAQLTRFIRGELAAGPEAQQHFDKVAAKVREVDAVDAFFEGRSMELDMLQTCEEVEAFDTTLGWPVF